MTRDQLSNLVRDPFRWAPEYIDRFRILQMGDESWRRERLTAFKLAYIAGYIAGFLAGGRTMKARATAAIKPFAKGCVSNGIIANASRAIDRLWVAGVPDDAPMWGRWHRCEDAPSGAGKDGET